MAWESRLAGYKMVAGTGDPSVFKYPARSTSAGIMVGAGFILAFGWMFGANAPNKIRYFVSAPVLVAGICFACFGLWHLLVLRRIEIHRAARRLVEIHRTPLTRREPRVVGFDQIRHISVNRAVSTEDGSFSDTIVVVLRDGGHVDFGNYTGPEGSVMAARLHELTGASIVSQPAS